MKSQNFRSVSPDLHISAKISDIISTDEDPGLRIESFAIIKLRCVATKSKIYFFTMQTFKELVTKIT